MKVLAVQVCSVNYNYNSIRRRAEGEGESYGKPRQTAGSAAATERRNVLIRSERRPHDHYSADRILVRSAIMVR